MYWINVCVTQTSIDVVVGCRWLNSIGGPRVQQIQQFGVSLRNGDYGNRGHYTIISMCVCARTPSINLNVQLIDGYTYRLVSTVKKSHLIFDCFLFFLSAFVLFLRSVYLHSWVYSVMATCQATRFYPKLC